MGREGPMIGAMRRITTNLVLPAARRHMATFSCRGVMSQSTVTAAIAACRGHRFMSAKPFTPLQESIDAVQKGSDRKFVESIDVAIRLNIDPRKADQALRGLVVLPHGTGKKMRIAVFATGKAADAAKEAGATEVGTDDLVEKIKNGWTDFDRAVATPSCMSFASKVARVLGPRGLMPNPKLGTVTDDVEGIIRRLNSGCAFKADKEGNIHAVIGKIDFSGSKIEENLLALVRALNEVKPKGVSGQYLLDVFLSSSMGLSYRVALPDILAKLGDAPAAEGTVKNVEKKKVVRRGIDPKEWATVDINSIASAKLKRYLLARRAAAGVPAPMQAKQ